MSQYIVHNNISIKATPDKVWEALTNPELTKKYFFNCAVLSDWKVGSTITFKGKMFFFINIEMKGKILQILPGELLQYNLKNGSDKNGSTSIVTDRLSYVNGETILSISDDVGDGVGAEKRYKRSEKGWVKILTGLKKVAEGM